MCVSVVFVNDVISFSSAGVYNVSLGVTDKTGEVANSTNITVTVTPPLVITNLKANRTYISAGQNVTFTNKTTGGTGSNKYYYTTNPEGCGYTTGRNNFTFPSAGSCNVILHVTDLSGEKNQSNDTHQRRPISILHKHNNRRNRQQQVRLHTWEAIRGARPNRQHNS